MIIGPSDPIYMHTAVDWAKYWRVPKTSLEQWEWAQPVHSLLQIGPAPGLTPDCQITCDIHNGELKYRVDKDWWECVGWDGEGCCVLTGLDVHLMIMSRPLPEDCEAFGVVWVRGNDNRISGIRVKVQSPDRLEEKIAESDGIEVWRLGRD